MRVRTFAVAGALESSNPCSLPPGPFRGSAAPGASQRVLGQVAHQTTMLLHRMTTV